MSQCHVCVRWAGRPFTEPSLVGEESNMRLKELLKKRDAELRAKQKEALRQGRGATVHHIIPSAATIISRAIFIGLLLVLILPPRGRTCDFGTRPSAHLTQLLRAMFGHRRQDEANHRTDMEHTHTHTHSSTMVQEHIISFGVKCCWAHLRNPGSQY